MQLTITVQDNGRVGVNHPQLERLSDRELGELFVMLCQAGDYVTALRNDVMHAHRARERQGFTDYPLETQRRPN